MKSAQVLREKVNSHQLTLGMIVTLHFWLDLVEISKKSGLDYLILDLEHLHHDEETIAAACSVGRMIDFPILIRPAETDYRTVRLAADLGPCGFLLPQVRHAAMLDEVRDGLCMPPRGKRRPGGHGNRWVSDYNYPTWVEQQERHWIVLPQIESREGLSNLDAIAKHELTTAMAVGPYDLSASLGVCWQPESDTLVGALESIRAAGKRAGKTTWMIGDGAALVKRGFTFLCVAEPVFALEAMLKSNVAALRKGTHAAAGSDKPLP